jgi:hypothetical protein
VPKLGQEGLLPAHVLSFFLFSLHNRSKPPFCTTPKTGLSPGEKDWIRETPLRGARTSRPPMRADAQVQATVEFGSLDAPSRLCRVALDAVDSDPTPSHSLGGYAGRAGSTEWINHDLAGESLCCEPRSVILKRRADAQVHAEGEQPDQARRQ